MEKKGLLSAGNTVRTTRNNSFTSNAPFVGWAFSHNPLPTFVNEKQNDSGVNLRLETQRSNTNHCTTEGGSHYSEFVFLLTV